MGKMCDYGLAPWKKLASDEKLDHELASCPPQARNKGYFKTLELSTEHLTIVLIGRI